jgi:hypothetical protein
MHAKHIIVIAVAMALFGCSTVNESTAFNAADFGPYESPGAAVIHGQAFVHTGDGRTFKASGMNVYLVPLTPYTDELAKIIQGNRNPAPPDPRLGKYTKAVVANAEGEFEFDGLPEGSYVVYSRVQWSRPRLGLFGAYYVAGEAVVAQGETKNLAVTNVSPID